MYKGIIVIIEYNGNKFKCEADWTEGYCKISTGQYLVADFVNGEPCNIRQVKLFVQPTVFSIAVACKD